MRSAWLLAALAFVAACDRASELPGSTEPNVSASALAPDGTSLLVARGESLYLASEYDSAEATWGRALTAARSERDTATEARVLTWIGLSARSRGEGTLARNYIEQGLKLQLQNLGGAGAGESYNALGLVALDEDRFEDARDAFARAVAYRGDRRLFAKATGNLGLSVAYLGDLAASRRHLMTMLDSSVALGERRFEANALANIAMLDIWEGRAADALPTLEQARVIYREIAFAPGEQNALGQLAVAYEGLGAFGAAFAALDSSLAIARSKGMREDEGEILRLIAGMHARVGDFPTALRQYEIAAQLADTNRATSEAASIRRRSSEIHLAIGNHDRARRDANSALVAHRADGARLDEVDDLLQLVEVERHAGSTSAAQARLREAASLAAALEVPSLLRSVRLHEARFAESIRDWPAVLRIVRALEKDAANVDVTQAAEAAALAARAWAALGTLDSASMAGARAIALLTTLRSNLASESLARTLIADRAAVFADQVTVLLRQGRTSEAFVVADAGRSRGLVDHLSSARSRFAVSTRGALSLEGEGLLREIDVILQLLRDAERVRPQERSPGSVATSAALVRRLDDARARYAEYVRRTTRDPTREATLLGGIAVDPSHVRSALEPDERLLEYLVAPDRIVLFVATRDSIHAIEQPGNLNTMTERVRVLRESWGVREHDWRAALPASRALHRELVTPAIRTGLLAGARRLIIVPHGVLSQIPFAALRSDSTDRWLVEDFEILHLPSAAALPVLRRGRASGLRSALTVFAPFPRELPATRTEARSVRRSAAGASMAVGDAASESAVRRALAEGRVVHVATHGVMNARNPLFSRVELARGRGAPRSDDDGRLEVHELLGMTVLSPLVFLSGCETSAFQAWLDDPVRGTDHATLAQAFLQAGAANVAGTLWRINDEGAAAFGAAFHENLSRTSPVAALASAQRRFLRDPRFDNPYYWASYLIAGAGRLDDSSEKSSNPSVSYEKRAIREPIPSEP